MKRLASRTLLVLGIWLIFGVLYAAFLRLHMPMYYREFSWGTALRWAIPDALVWAVLSAVPMYLVRQLPFARPHLVRHILIHLVVACALAVLHSTLDAWFSKLNGGYENFTWFGAAAMRVRESVHTNMLIYAVVAVIGQYLLHAGRLREEKRRAAELHAQLSEAKLSALRMQLRPHFLMNALHTVSGLVDARPEEAKRVIRKIGDMLRASLRSERADEITLREELGFIEAYLDIERTRFQDRLQVRVDIDPDCLECVVPMFVLQPLVENAIRHGVSDRSAGGEVRVSARSRGDDLELEVRDNGPGFGHSLRTQQSSTGVGIRNLSERLRTLYGARAELTLENGSAEGVRVRIRMPRRIHSPSEAVQPASPTSGEPVG